MERKKQIGYPVAMDLDSYDVRFWADGDCMDSSDSPIRIKNGQRVFAHSFTGMLINCITGFVWCNMLQVENDTLPLSK